MTLRALVGISPASLNPTHGGPLARLLYAIHGRGRGHATRSRAIIEALRSAGHDVRIMAGPEALPVFEGDVAIDPIVSLVPGMGVGTAPAFWKRFRADRGALAKSGAQLLISDGDMPSVVAATSRKIPSISVGHGLVFSHGVRPAGIPQGPWSREARKSRRAAWTSNLQVAVNFVPIEARVKTATIARPTLRPGLERAKTSGGEIVCYFRDENGGPILQALVEAGERPQLFAHKDPKIDGVTLSPRDEGTFIKALAGARAVISSAGSQLISECTALGIPQFALFDARDDEQRLNVAMLAQAGVGTGTSFSEFNPGALAAFLEGIAKEGFSAPGAQWDGPTASEAVGQSVETLLS